MKSKKWRTTKIGKKIKMPNSTKMRGLYSNKKAKLRNKLKVEKETKRKKIKQIRLDLKKIEGTFVSLTGLNQLSKQSIKNLQDTRQIVMMRLIRNMSDLMVSTKSVTKLEKQLQSIKKKENSI